MPWQAPTFDITGKNYTVDPRPVQEVIQQGANIQKDSLKTLAGVVQSGVDVAQGMMARRQLSELKSQIANLDPLSPDYAVTRANLLANNMTAFTDPRTKGVASEILSGFDKARDNDLAKQKAAITAANYMDRLRQSNENRVGQMAVGHGYRTAENIQKDILRGEGGGSVDNVGPSIRSITDRYNTLMNPGAKPAPATPPPAGQPQERVATNQQIEPDLPTGDNKGPIDNSLLNPAAPVVKPGDTLPPAAPAAPAPAGGGKYLADPEEEDEGGPGSLGPPGPQGTAGAAAPPPAAPAAETPAAPTAKEQEQVEKAQDPGWAKAALLEETNKTISDFNKSTTSEERSAAAQIKKRLEADPDVITFNARTEAAFAIQKEALMEAHKQKKGLEETNTTIKDRVETAVKYQMAREDAALSLATKRADELRKQFELKGADTATLGPLLKKADEDVAVMAAKVNEDRALLEAEWTEKIRERPNAFLEDKREAEKQAREAKIAKSWDDFTASQDDPGMQGSPVTHPGGYTPPATPPRAASDKPPGIDLRRDAPQRAERAAAQVKANSFWDAGKAEAAKLANLKDATDEELRQLAERDSGQLEGPDTWLGLSASNDPTEKLAAEFADKFNYPPGGDDSRTSGRSGKVPVADFLQAAAEAEQQRRRKAAALAALPAEAGQKAAAEVPGFTVKKVYQH